MEANNEEEQALYFVLVCETVAKEMPGLLLGSAVFYWLTLAIGLPINFILLYIILRRMKDQFKQLSSIAIFSLAVVHNVFLLIMLVYGIIYVRGDDPTALIELTLVFITAEYIWSAFILLSTSIIRIVAIRQPFLFNKYKQNTKLYWLMIVGISSLTALILTPSWYFASRQNMSVQAGNQSVSTFKRASIYSKYRFTVYTSAGVGFVLMVAIFIIRSIVTIYVSRLSACTRFLHLKRDISRVLMSVYYMATGGIVLWIFSYFMSRENVTDVTSAEMNLVRCFVFSKTSFLILRTVCDFVNHFLCLSNYEDIYQPLMNHCFKQQQVSKNNGSVELHAQN